MRSGERPTTILSGLPTVVAVSPSRQTTKQKKKLKAQAAERIISLSPQFYSVDRVEGWLA
jgi:hypothetical protein